MYLLLLTTLFIVLLPISYQLSLQDVDKIRTGLKNLSKNRTAKEILEIQNEIMALVKNNVNFTNSSLEMRKTIEEILTKIDGGARSKYNLWIKGLRGMEHERTEKLRVGYFLCALL